MACASTATAVTAILILYLQCTCCSLRLPTSQPKLGKKIIVSQNEIWMSESVIGLCLHNKFVLRIVYKHEKNENTLNALPDCLPAMWRSVFIVAAGCCRYRVIFHSTFCPERRRHLRHQSITGYRIQQQSTRSKASVCTIYYTLPSHRRIMAIIIVIGVAVIAVIARRCHNFYHYNILFVRSFVLLSLVWFY